MKNLLKRFRLWQLERMYRDIHKIEGRCGVAGLTMRGEFAVATFRMMDEEQTLIGWNRQQRREWRRRILGHV